MSTQIGGLPDQLLRQLHLGQRLRTGSPQTLSASGWSGTCVTFGRAGASSGSGTDRLYGIPAKGFREDRSRDEHRVEGPWVAAEAAARFGDH